METTIDHYADRVRQCLQAAGKYSAALELNIFVLAGSLQSLALALAEIATLDKVTLEEKTARGSLTHVHPAFRIRMEAEESCRKQMKELGLTAIGVRQIVDRDPMTEMLGELKDSMSKSKRTVKPD